MHKSFYEFEAENHYQLGLKMGTHFKREIKKLISANKDEGFEKRLALAKNMFELTKDHFPEYMEELKGWSDGANVDLYEFWLLAIEDDAEIEMENPGKCTTLITNDGKLLAHSEDWDTSIKENLYLIKKSVGGLTTLELYYLGTLGGTSVGINSNGFATGVNTLFFKPKQMGISKCVIERMFLDTKNPEADFNKIRDLKIADGYSQNVTSINGEIVNIELATDGSVLERHNSPYVHSNHCLILKDNNSSNEDYVGTLSRLKIAKEKVSERNTISEIQDILEDNSLGPDKSINNERTVGRMIVDLENLVCYVWLLREDKLGWVKYPIDFIGK